MFGWLGLETDWPVAGVDLGAALAGAPSDATRPLYASSPAFGPERESVVRGDEKRISDGGSGAGALVFDLGRDPEEREPLGDGAELAGLLAEYRANTAPRARSVRLSKKELEALQAIGYLREVESD